jgi:hypothetical protein
MEIERSQSQKYFGFDSVYVQRLLEFEVVGFKL